MDFPAWWGGSMGNRYDELWPDKARWNTHVSGSQFFYFPQCGSSVRERSVSTLLMLLSIFICLSSTYLPTYYLPTYLAISIHPSTSTYLGKKNEIYVSETGLIIQNILPQFPSASCIVELVPQSGTLQLWILELIWGHLVHLPFLPWKGGGEEKGERGGGKR